MRGRRELGRDGSGGDASGAGVAAQAFEIGAKFAGVLVTEIAIFFEGFADDAFELGRKVGMQAGRREWRTIENGFEDYAGSFTAKG